ncbi:unnamed protein product [Urochloa humidicola]
MALFREVLDECGLKDIGFSGIPWTYDNRKSGQRNVKVRLDRGVATQEWMDRFFDASITHLTSPVSDHCPLLLTVQVENRRQNGGKQQYYEIMWECDPSLDDSVAQFWSREQTKGDLGTIHRALKGMMQALKEWSHERFGSVRKEIERLRTHLAALQDAGSDDNEIKNTIR